MPPSTSIIQRFSLFYVHAYMYIYAQIHPQVEEYWGHVNPIGPRACYDEGKRVAETMAYAYAKQVWHMKYRHCN